jgi:hypothetical protein
LRLAAPVSRLLFHPPLGGYSVALSGDGNTALVGGLADNGDAGAAWVYIRSGGIWSQQAKLIDPGSGLQGFSVSLSGDGDPSL